VELKKQISNLCKKFNIREEKLQNLHEFMSEEEYEQIMACQRYAINSEKKIKNKLKNNERLVQSKMALPEILRNSYIQITKDEGLHGKSLLNKKY
jgi:hypothetical protein